MKEIYAKSQPHETLREHTEKCLSVLASLRQAFPYLPEVCQHQNLFRDLFYALYLHDLGKAAAGFQEMLEGGKAWRYRHEILSAGFVTFIEDLDNLSRSAITLAVITHHRSVSRLSDYSQLDLWMSKRGELVTNWAQIQDWLAQLPATAQKYFYENIPSPKIPKMVENVVDAYHTTAQAYKWTVADDDDEEPELYALYNEAKLYSALLRGLLITCDHLASGGRTKVLSPVRNLVQRLHVTSPYPFQRKLSTHKGSALLESPTGSGKTEASLMWAVAQQDCGRRLFYVLPYTASINAMLRRFNTDYDLKEEVGALHGKASYFAYSALCEQDYDKVEAAKSARMTQDLSRQVYRPIKIITPFQIIKSFFGVRGWEAQWGEFAGGLFIFDEIHVYDARTTALIFTVLEYLRQWDAKFLFMSATFPKFLKEKLRETIPEISFLKPSPDEEEDKILLQKVRHQVVRLDGEIFNHIDTIRGHLANNKRVLVVCNTVARAQRIFSLLKNFLEKDKAVLLHSRFMLRDRERIERRISEPKKKDADNDRKSLTQLLVGTQVIEVSLDISYDIIFTEPAPIDALIQRFGRVNRYGEKQIADVHICNVGGEFDHYIYDPERIEKTLEELPHGAQLSQQFVSRAVDRVYGAGYNVREKSTFDAVKSAFHDIIRGLTPFEDSDQEDSFYEMIRSVQVVPKDYESDFIRILDEEGPLEASRYFATISLGQGMKLKNLDALSPRTFDNGKRHQRYFVAQTDYGENQGLLMESVDTGGKFL